MTIAELFRAEGMKQGIEQGIEQGMKQGVKQGMKQGMKQGVKQIALKLLEQGSDIAFVAQLTELSIEEINALKTEAVH